MGENSPALDQFVQQDLGKAFRESLEERESGALPDALETLLDELKSERRHEPRH